MIRIHMKYELILCLKVGAGVIATVLMLSCVVSSVPNFTRSEFLIAAEKGDVIHLEIDWPNNRASGQVKPGSDTAKIYDTPDFVIKKLKEKLPDILELATKHGIPHMQHLMK